MPFLSARSSFLRRSREAVPGPGSFACPLFQPNLMTLTQAMHCGAAVAGTSYPFPSRYAVNVSISEHTHSPICGRTVIGSFFITFPFLEATLGSLVIGSHMTNRMFFRVIVNLAQLDEKLEDFQSMTDGL